MDNKGNTRYKRNKKWLDAEVQQLLDYLVEEKEFECPTAQMYYRKFLHVKNIDATWKLVRGKVRYLKLSYQNAENWKNSIDAGLIESAAGTSEVKKRILTICPNYVKLHKVFGSHLDDEDSLSFEALDVPTSDNAEYLDTLQPEHVSVEDIEYQDNSSNEQTSDTEDSNAMCAPVTSTSKRKAADRSIVTASRKKTRSHYWPSMNARATDLATERQEFEQWRIEQELQLRREELAIRREELNVRKMQIEKDERIAMYEIEMKYKNNGMK